MEEREGMTIKEVEQMTGLARSNIRFYEKENLIHPVRNGSNGYREYSGDDVKNIKKIAYLRTLGISIEDIRKLSNKEVNLYQILEKQRQILEHQISELENSRVMCERMLSAGEIIDYESLDVEKYISDLEDYWKDNRSGLKMDSVGFVYTWSGDVIWKILTLVCLIIAIFSYPYLPVEIPIQWSQGFVSRYTDKNSIFIFPLACVIIKYALRPLIWKTLSAHAIYSKTATNYLINYMCFVVFSVEVFTILYVYKFVKYVTVLLFADTVILIGVLLLAGYKMCRKKF